jgi:hypothetical protein
MRARSGPVRAFSTKDEAVRFAGRQLGGHYAVYHKHRKIWPAPSWSLLASRPPFHPGGMAGRTPCSGYSSVVFRPRYWGALRRLRTRRKKGGN